MKKKSRWQLFKEAVKNPKPERLAKIEYQSYILQFIGIVVTCVFLITKGLWYVIFAMVFALGIMYAQGVNAYRKYQNIMEFVPKENPKDFIDDISPTRRKGKIITYVFGDKLRWVSAVLSVLFTYLILGSRLPWYLSSILYPSLLLGFFMIIYFELIYKIAYPIYKRRIKNG